MSIVVLLTLVTSVLFLVTYGAGIHVWSVLLTGIALSGATWLACRHAAPPPENTSRHSIYPILHIALIGFVVLTLIPLPKMLSVITGPRRYQQNAAVVEILEAAEATDLCEPLLPLFSATRNRAGSLRVLLLLAAMFSAFEAVRLLHPRHRIVYLHILIGIGILVAILGYLSLVVFPQGNKLWWLFSMPPFHRPSVGCFLNANHYAGFVALLATGALGAAMLHLQKRCWFRAALTTLAGLAMAVFVVLSASKGAVIALSAGMAAVTIALLCHLRGRVRLVGIAIIGIAIVLSTGIVAQNPTVRTRLAALVHPKTDGSFQPRLNAWRGTVRMWTHYPLIGVGANAFRFAYPQHKDATHRAYRRFAENEVLHILGEGGIIGLLLVGAILVSIVILLKQSLRSPSEHEHELRGLAVCSVAMLATAAVHVSVDFILHLPLYAIVLASGAALGTRHGAPAKGRRLAITATAIVALCLTPGLKAMTKYDASAHVATRSADELAMLLTWSPTNAQLWRRLGATAAERGTPETHAIAERCLEMATAYDPCDFNIWIQLGKLHLKRNDRQGAKEAFSRATDIRSWAPVPRLEPER